MKNLEKLKKIGRILSRSELKEINGSGCRHTSSLSVNGCISVGYECWGAFPFQDGWGEYNKWEVSCNGGPVLRTYDDLTIY